MKIAYFIIGIVLMSMFILGFGLFISDISTHTGVTYDQTDIELMYKFDEINNITKEINQRTMNQTTDRNWLDIIGNFYSDTKDVVRLSGKSIDTFNDVGAKTFDVLHLGSFYSFITVIILILFIFGVILAILVGKEMI